MDVGTYERFRQNLQRQRQNLVDWLKGTPPTKKGIALGPVSEDGVQTRLEKLEEAIAKTEAHTFGLCTVCHEDVNADLLEMDFTACVCLDHFSDDQRRRLEQDLELSHKVQKALLPKEAPSIPGLRIAAFIQPAEIVGGDYFDFFRFKDGSYGIAIADVMGKGLPASMLVASLQASLRILVPDHDSPADVMKRLNNLFCNNIHLIKFITIVLARYNPDTRILEYCNAGHNPPLHLHAANGLAVTKLMPTGAAIGLTETMEYANEKVELQKGDSLLLYTDGATEARNASAEEFSENRLSQWLTANAHLEPKGLIDGIRNSLREFTGSKVLQDDLTLVAGKLVA